MYQADRFVAGRKHHIVRQSSKQSCVDDNAARRRYVGLAGREGHAGGRCRRRLTDYSQLYGEVANLVTCDDDVPKYCRQSSAKLRQLESHSCTAACLYVCSGCGSKQMLAIQVPTDVTARRVKTLHHALPARSFR